LKHLTDLLTYPGNGVHTVHTAKEKKEQIFKLAFGSTNPKIVQKKWNESLKKISDQETYILGIPSDNGGGIQRGANWGPLAIREKIYENFNPKDLGDIRVIPHLLHDKYLNQDTIKACQKALYGSACSLPVSPLSICEKVLEKIYKKFPNIKIFGLGGDHSVSYPLVKSWLKHRKDKSKAGIIHFDAHTDLLEKRLGIDLCFGTWTFQILEDLYSRDHIVQLGIRSSGKTKQYWKKTLGVSQIWSHEINSRGVNSVYKKIKKHFNKIGIEEIYITFDIDALDAKYAAATGTPEHNGLTPPTCSALIKLLGQDFKITGADLVEVAPFVWPENISPIDQRSSLDVAGDIAGIIYEELKK
jgi:agmatinase